MKMFAPFGMNNLKTLSLSRSTQREESMHTPDRDPGCPDRTTLVARGGVSVRCCRPIRLVGAVGAG